MDCEKFIDIFVLFCIIAGLSSYLYTKKSNYKWFPGQKSTVRGFGNIGHATNVSNIGIVASNFSGGGVNLPVEPFTTFTKWGEPNPYNSRRELSLKQAF